MPDPRIPAKEYFRIGEVARIVGVKTSVLRFWETEFRSVRPQKSRTNQRLYARRHVERLLAVKELLYAQGFTIAGAKRRLVEMGDSACADGDRVGGAAGQPGLDRVVDRVKKELQELLQLLDE
jgi:DNA-binding transcriptional MerR regulator